MFVPLQSVCRDSHGSYWFDPAYTRYSLESRFGFDIEVVDLDRTAKLRFLLTEAYRDRIGLDFWKKFLDDPRDQLEIRDFVWDLINTTDDWWVRDCIPAEIEVDVAEDFSFENIAHKFFFFGGSMQKLFPVYGVIATAEGEELTDKPIRYLTLHEFHASLDTLEFKSLLDKEREAAKNHLDFLKSLPRWETELSRWTGE